MGTSDAEGKYKLLYNGDIEGAVLGEHRVNIYTAAADQKTSETGEKLLGSEDGEEPIVNWPTPVTVKAGENTQDFDLDKQ